MKREDGREAASVIRAFALRVFFIHIFFANAT